MKKSSLLFTSLLLVASLGLSACGTTTDAKKDQGAAPQTTTQAPATTTTSGLPDSVVKAGKIVFASDTTYPPMEFINDNKQIDGFDFDLINALAAKLGVKAEMQTTGWDALLPGLTAKRYDAVISSMNVTEERLKQVDFVTYAKLSQVFVVRKGDAAIAKLDDLAGKVVAVQKDTTSEELAKGIKGVKSITTFDSFADTFLELKAKRADVVVIDEPVGLYYATKNPNDYSVTGQAAAPDPIGIAVAKDNQKLNAALTKALDEIKKDGTYATLSKKWFGNDISGR